MCRSSGNKHLAAQALRGGSASRARHGSGRRWARTASDAAASRPACPLQALDIPSLTVILPVRELPASAPEQRHPEGSDTNERGQGQPRRQKHPAPIQPEVKSPAHFPVPTVNAPDGHIDIRA